MADKSKKVPENTEGAWYVDNNCSACGLCADTAPDHFKMTDDGDHAYVYRQPGKNEDESACSDALDGCPELAIGKDG